jgi:hypothetical protein
MAERPVCEGIMCAAMDLRRSVMLTCGKEQVRGLGDVKTLSWVALWRRERRLLWGTSARVEPRLSGRHHGPRLGNSSTSELSATSADNTEHPVETPIAAATGCPLHLRDTLVPFENIVRDDMLKKNHVQFKMLTLPRNCHRLRSVDHWKKKMSRIL